MNNFKNLLIAVLTGLLALSLFTQPAQSAPKTYDAVKLIQYDRCLEIASINATLTIAMDYYIKQCVNYLP